MQTEEMLLTTELQAAACRIGSEWGWKPEAISHIIRGAEEVSLLNVGGQLQFLLPGGTCECYWISANVLVDEPDGLSWHDRVKLAAEKASEQFADLQVKFDFLAEGRKALGKNFASFEAACGDPRDRVCFIWYLEAEPV